MQFLKVETLLFLFVLVIASAALFAYSFARRRKMLRAFAETPLLKKINCDVSLTRQVIKALLLTASAALVIIALARPVTNPRPRRVVEKARDIAVLLDVSRSMLAEDIRPNRLERAKIAINDLLEVLRGDRIGLITFAGNAVIKCPLTRDYPFMRLALSEVSTESTGRGGTMIGDAIRKALNEMFDDKTDSYRDIILITDGGDQESFPEQAAAKASEMGIRIIAIGLGDPQEGTPIPVKTRSGVEYIKDKQGDTVLTKLNEKQLRKIAFAGPRGRYLSVKTGTFNLDEIYLDMIATAARRELESAMMMRYDELYQWFLAGALTLLLTERLISEKKRSRNE